MRELFQNLLDSISNAAYILPAIAGGIVDYLNQIQRGDKNWSIIGFLVHMLSALFFGWFAGSLAAEMGYSSNIIASCGGLGGFLGVRLADLVIYRVFKIDQRMRKDGIK